MRIALCQINPTLGDFSANAEKVVTMAKQAAAQGCDVALFCEMTLFGYHPCDLLERPSVVIEQIGVLDKLVPQLPRDLACVFGSVQLNPKRGKPYFNSALWVHEGVVKKTFNKELLPVYDVFDDSRHFSPGRIVENTFLFKGKKFLVLICEDMWGWDPIHEVNPIESMSSGTVDYVLNLSASPVATNKPESRLQMARQTARHLQAPLAYVNMVGGQDELIFDGGSFAIDREGNEIAHSSYFKEDLIVVDLAAGTGEFKKNVGDELGYIKESLVLGLRDFFHKVGFKRAHLGISGGIDSALVATIAAEAIGGDKLTLMALPTQFNAKESHELACQLAKNLKSEIITIPIQENFAALVKTYELAFGTKEFGVMHENIQARIRGLLLMAFANEHFSLLLTAGNKSEYATGYTTLYGDMCGGLAVIGDLLKQQVYQMANYINRQQELIPQRIIDRPPSAELRPNQVDQDFLPDYDKLDAAVDNIICGKNPGNTELDRWVIERSMASEFKRWQAPPILKVSHHAFGQGRRMPIAHRARV